MARKLLLNELRIILSCGRNRNALITVGFRSSRVIVTLHCVVQPEVMTVECSENAIRKTGQTISGGHFVGGELNVAEMPGPASG